ncbi:efflux RND transporter periplasmic adaptor subunit [Parafilimonas sp.]|uniref:efflux RND transporter periplasmic adaptor subunit n=1 Tax=Parafilimonas sp. TaxID=1969739 RepID=UPI0039E60009
MKRFLSISAVIITVTSAASCHEKKEAPKPGKFVLSDTMAKMIAIDTVTTCNVDDALTLSGQVSFNENNVIKVFPRSSGQVTESKVTLGDKVKKGQVLAVIRSADVAGNYADLSGADADIAIAKREMENQQSLYQNGIASEKDYNEARQNYQKALSAKEKIQSSISINSGTRSSASGVYQLVAPIDGYVVEKKVNAGDFIRSDMGDNLFTISDLKNVWIWANVFEADIARVHEGDNVEVTTLAFPNKVYTGKIDQVSQVLDPENKAMKVRISLSNAGLTLKPQMFAKVTVATRQSQQALCIPFSSLIADNGKNYIISYYANDSLKVNPVNLLQVSGSKAFISGDIKPGDKLITKNQLLIYTALNSEF